MNSMRHDYHPLPIRQRKSVERPALRDPASLKRLCRLIRGWLPLLLAAAGYPSRAERKQQQHEERQGKPHAQT